MKPRISLEQWQAFMSVVETGSYARASAELNKSQSTISYAVSKIEDLLDIKVFTIVGRKAELTPAGQALYRQCQILVHQAADLEDRARSLASGWESELRLAIEMIFPPNLLLHSLDELAKRPPEPRIELFESVLGGTEELLQSRQVDLAICSQVPTGFIGDYLMHVTLTAVASPNHPLHQLNRDLSLNDLRSHRQLVFRDSGTQRTTKAALEISEARWTVSHKATSIRAVCMGLGYAWFPKESIGKELESGELKPLPLEQGAERLVALYIAYGDPETVGPAAKTLANLIKESVDNTQLLN